MLVRLCCVLLFGPFGVAVLALMQGINNPRKDYPFPRVIPNHIWLLIVAIAVASYDHWISWPAGVKMPEYPVHRQTPLILPCLYH